MERPALMATRRMSGRRSKRRTGKPRFWSSMAKRGPARPGPISVIVGFSGIGGLFRGTQHGASFPELGEELLIERETQIRRTCTAARSHLHTDGAFDHLDVAQTPADDEFVKFGETLADVDPI